MRLSIFLAYPLISLLLPVYLFASPRDAAIVLSVNPGVESILTGQRASLAPKMEIPLKATVKSDATGHSQLIFPDDATITISPNSEVALSEFVDDPGEENIVLDMAVGAMRVITGEASRRNPAAFTVNTPQATIGIRGTMVIIQVTGDLTSVYLSETSGQGVNVRSNSSGRAIDLRSPGHIITVGPQIFEDHKATRQHVASLKSALQRPIPRTLGLQEVAMQTSPASLSAQSNLPFTTRLTASQMDEANRSGQVAYVESVNSLPATETPANPSSPVTPVVPPASPGTSGQPATPPLPTQPSTPATPETPTPEIPTPEVPSTTVTPDVPPITPGTPDTPANPSAYKVTMPELAGNFTGTGNFNYYYVQDPGTAFGNARSGAISFSVPQTYVSLESDVYTINITNVKVPGFQNGQYIPVPATGHDLPIRVNRQSGEISQAAGQTIVTTPQEIRALMLKGTFENNQQGILDTVHFTAGTDASGMPLHGRNQGNINISKP